MNNDDSLCHRVVMTSVQLDCYAWINGHGICCYGHGIYVTNDESVRHKLLTKIDE
jgi:hypothetical protein